ncbi:MAG: alpha/beta fold hydrolase [Alistipes sp.]|jgi:pimeloyl-ACP methyl ester carboxylesterase|nr:alpha/beta fold hydrolase [Alistipes sp.]
MEKFIMADGVAIRVSDTLEPGSNLASGGDAGAPEKPKDKGVAPTVLLLHGYLENLNIWDEVAEFLRPHARVIALDLPGHGISEVRGEVHSMDFLADVAHGALLELNAPKCFVVGHSMGGYVAIALAARYPEVLDGLVLLSSTPNADSEAKREDREREIAIVRGGKKELLAHTVPAKGFAPENRRGMADVIEDLAELVMLTEDEGIVALLRGMAARPDRNDLLRGLSARPDRNEAPRGLSGRPGGNEVLGGASGRPGDEALLRTLAAEAVGGRDSSEGIGSEAPSEEIGSEVGIPQLFIFGRHDEYIPAEVADAIVAAHPQASVQWLEHSGHMGLVEEPRILSQVILDFIKTNIK